MYTETPSVPMAEWLRQQRSGRQQTVNEERVGLLDTESGVIATYIKVEQKRTRIILFCGAILCIIASFSFVALGFTISRTQTNIEWAVAEVLPHLHELVNLTVSMTRDAKATMSHMHSASESGDFLASAGTNQLLMTINGTSRMVERMEKLMQKPTVQFQLQ